MLGWNKDLDLSGLGARTPWQHGPQGSKRSKSERGTVQDLIGNSVSLPDIAMVLTCCLLASPGSPFGDSSLPVDLAEGFKPNVFMEHEINPKDAVPDLAAQYETMVGGMLGE